MLAEHTENGVIAGIDRAIRDKASAGERWICGWTWFNDYIRAAQAAVAPLTRSLPRDPIAAIKNVDRWKLVAPSLLNKGPWEIVPWLEARAREHGVEPIGILDALVSILSAVDETRYADKPAAIKAILAGSSCSARTRISHWHSLDAVIARTFAGRQAA